MADLVSPASRADYVIRLSENPPPTINKVPERNKFIPEYFSVEVWAIYFR